MVGNTETIQKRAWRTFMAISQKPTSGPENFRFARRSGVGAELAIDLRAPLSEPPISPRAGPSGVR